MRRLWLTTLGVLVFAVLACAPPPARPPAARAVAKSGPVALPLFAPWVRPAPAPPFQLTASDGAGLVISSVTASGSIEDPLALTEVHMVFQSESAQPTEGRFTFTIPEGAALSRFAMKVDGKWQEGEVVEKQRARVSYEDFVHRRVDPALLERGAGNELAVRIFPILFGQKREIIVTYSQTLVRDVPYRIHLAGLPRVGRLTTSVHAQGELLSHDEQEKIVPADVVVQAARWSAADAVALRAGSNVVARVRVPADAGAGAAIESLIAVVDTSASRAGDLGDEIEALRALVATLPPDTSVRVACFDQTVMPVFDGKASELGEATFARIRGRQALGASDPAVAIAWAALAARAAPGVKHRLLFLSDGVFTRGSTRATDLAEAAKALHETGIARADAIAFGSIRDEATLGALVKSGLAASGVVVPFDAGKDVIARKLTQAVLPAMPVSLPGAAWSFPTSVEAQPGDEVTVFANVPSERTNLELKLGPHTIALARRGGSRAFVERAVAQAQIAEVLSNDASSEKQRRDSIALSLRHRIVTRDTAMLVLEKDTDYDRFQINRRAKVEVLAVRDGRVAVLSQARIAPGGVAPANAVDTQLVETAESQTLANRTTGLTAKAPSVRMGSTSVSGRLPPEIVQRIVRANFGRFRGCYLKGLEKHPRLEGRVAVRFVIGRDGAVSSVRIAESTLASAIAEGCIAKAFYWLQFPQPEGGVIVVDYPLQLSPDGDKTPPPASLASQRIRKYNPWQYQPSAPAPEPTAYSGRFAKVMSLIADDELGAATLEVDKWRREAPNDVMSLLALGEVAETSGDRELAARAYGSILELWSYRADMRRLAGERLERIGTDAALALAVEAYAGALQDRPDHPSSHHLYAMALLKQGQPKRAFDVLDKAVQRSFISARFPGVHELLRGDLAIAGAAWAAAEPIKAEGIRARLLERDLTIDKSPSTRFVMVWESDTTDVNLHVVDGNGNEQGYGVPGTITNAKLGSNITDGFGPEQLVITGEEDELVYPLQLKARFSSRGQGGNFAMGKVEVVRHDGAGKLRFEQRPFVLMEQGATLSLGAVEKPAEKLAAVAAK